MKNLFLMLTSLFLAVNIASATPIQEVDFSSYSNNDSKFLFNGNTNTTVLSFQEMKDTEGEFWHIMIPLGFGWGLSRAYAPSSYGQANRPLWKYW